MIDLDKPDSIWIDLLAAIEFANIIPDVEVAMRETIETSVFGQFDEQSPIFLRLNK